MSKPAIASDVSVMEDWPQQRRDDWADGYEFARFELSEERTSCPGCSLHPEMRRFVTEWELLDGEPPKVIDNRLGENFGKPLDGSES